MSQSQPPSSAPLSPSAARNIPSPADARRALVERIDRTLRKIERTLAAEAGTTGIHDVRKAVKEYRALLRLIAGEEARAARRAAGDASRALSATRDRQAARDALQVLRGADRLDDADLGVLLPLIGSDETASGDATAGLSGLIRWVAEARAIHASTLDPLILEADLMGGLRRGYARARAAAHWDTPEHIHDLRKRVVTHRYQLSFFAKLHGGIGALRAGQVQELRELLGTCQDIEALGGVVEQIRAQAPDALPDALRDRLKEAGRAHQAQLVREAKRTHGRLFHRKPKAFMARLERKWRTAAARTSA